MGPVPAKIVMHGCFARVGLLTFYQPCGSVIMHGQGREGDEGQVNVVRGVLKGCLSLIGRVGNNSCLLDVAMGMGLYWLRF